MDPDEMLGPKEAAALLGISTDTLIRYGNLGRVRYTLLASGHRRYRRKDLAVLGTVVERTDQAEDTDPEGNPT